MAAVLPYRVEYAIGPNICKRNGCNLNCNDELQYAIMEHSPADDCATPIWFHVECFFAIRRPISECVIEGFGNLRLNHQKEIIQFLSPGAIDEFANAFESEIRFQKNMFFTMYYHLKTLSHNDYVDILTTNNQFIPENKTDILNHLTDVICFGALSPCPICKDGKFVFNNFTYRCTGYDSAWTKCVNTTKEPKRIPFKIPKQYQELLGKDCAPQTRIVRNIFELNDDEIEFQVKQPLFGMEFLIIGETKQLKNDIEHKIRLMGGKVVKIMHKDIAAVISNAAELQRIEGDIKSAAQLGIHVVSEEFLDDVIDNDPTKVIEENELSNWGRNLNGRVEPWKLARTFYNVSSVFYKHLKSVDPVLEQNATIHCVGDQRYDVTLDFVDISSNKNSFYKLEMLKSAKSKYLLRESMGRIGTLGGSKNLIKCTDIKEAETEFKKIFLNKTGNEFGTKEFVKKSGKYNQVNIDYEALCRKHPLDLVPTKLTKAIYELMGLLFVDDVMKSELLAFCLAGDSMPLGKLTMQQIHDALNLLGEISIMLELNNEQNHRILAASNQFYSWFPYGTGFKRPSIINTHKLVEEKISMLQNITEKCLKYDILTSQLNDEKNLFDVCYEHLANSAEIKMVNKLSEMYAQISKYVTNTQLRWDLNPFANQMPVIPNYSPGNYEIGEIFEVTRHEEKLRYAPYERSFNRQLLFHGTPINNFVGILTNGLKISPTEAHFSGSVFGNGIYFSDSVAKSVNYCRTVGQSGVILLCEVAAGNSDIRYRFDHSELKENCDSLQGLGKYYPHPVHVCDDGLIIPNGKLVQRDEEADLNFNEFVIFDTSRVKIRYMVQLNFT